MIDSGSGSRSTVAQAASRLALRSTTSSSVGKTVLYSSAKRAASRDERGPATPPRITGMAGVCTGFGLASQSSST